MADRLTDTEFRKRIIKGARKGGFARAKKLSKARRVAIARYAANIRWGNVKKRKRGK